MAWFWMAVQNPGKKWLATEGETIIIQGETLVVHESIDQSYRTGDTEDFEDITAFRVSDPISGCAVTPGCAGMAAAIEKAEEIIEKKGIDTFRKMRSHWAGVATQRLGPKPVML